jgi:glycolate oxidase iron-sulfur subunit
MVHTSSVKSPHAVAGDVSGNPVDIIRKGAGRCVACGLCLPHCPTYRKTKSELESPRGRLSLMLGVTRGELEPTRKLESHLSLCLTCRACETVCPAQVPFGDAMDAARAHLAARGAYTVKYRALLYGLTVLTRPMGFTLARAGLWLYRRSGLQTLLRASGILRLLGIAHADAMLTATCSPTPFASHYPAQGPARGTVGLFLGCIARLTDSETLHSTIHVLTRLGYHVHVPPAQSCCGALHRHGGDATTAETLMRENVSAFAGTHVDAIITAASGCAATLVEYRGGDAVKQFARNVVDINSFLQKIEWPAHVALRPLAKRVAVQDPCTLTNVLHTPGAPYELLRRIPQIDVVPLPENKLCCGAAGAYHLEHKDMARQLRDDKLTHLRRVAPDILVTANVGCAMHLAAGVREDGMAVEIMHPVTLIAGQLEP